MNACDLEETRHQALQKFYELAESGEWDSEFDPYTRPHYSHTCGPFKVRPNGVLGNVMCGDVCLIALHGPYDPREHPLLKATKKQVKAYEKEKAQIESSREYAAIQQAVKRATEQKKLRDDREQCEKLMVALGQKPPTDRPKRSRPWSWFGGAE